MAWSADDIFTHFLNKLRLWVMMETAINKLLLWFQEQAWADCVLIRNARGCLLCSFGDVDIALFSAGGSISKKFGHIASDAGATVSTTNFSIPLVSCHSSIFSYILSDVFCLSHHAKQRVIWCVRIEAYLLLVCETFFLLFSILALILFALASQCSCLVL